MRRWLARNADGRNGANVYPRPGAPSSGCVELDHRAHRTSAVVARARRRRPDVRLGVTGCMAQHLREKLARRAPWVDLLVGPDGYRRLPELLRGGDRDPHLALRLDPSETYADLPVARAGGVRAWVTVMR